VQEGRLHRAGPKRKIDGRPEAHYLGWISIKCCRAWNLNSGRKGGGQGGISRGQNRTRGEKMPTIKRMDGKDRPETAIKKYRNASWSFTAYP